MAKHGGKKTKLIMSASTKSIQHHPSSKHVASKKSGGKSRGKRVLVKS